MGSADISAGVARILDANVNRAREAMRVAEAYCRFVLDDPSLTQAVKDARHALAQAIPDGLRDRLLACRDVAGDVGTEVETAAEYVRACSADVATAALKRLTEALRTIEEYVKTVDASIARRIEQLRYGAYDLELRLQRHRDARRRFGEVRVYVLLTESICRGGVFRTAEAVLAGGADCLQLREKSLPDRVLLDRARRLADLCRSHGAMLIVNDRVDVARISGADGVHVGQDDLPVEQVRRVLSGEAVVGVSTHSESQIRAAIGSAPDYVAVGPMFASTTQPGARVAGVDLLARAAGMTSLPLVAIGGITPDNAPEVLRACPRACLCVCGAVLDADDPASVVRLIRSCVRESADD